MEVGKPTSIFRNDHMNYKEAREYIDSRAKFGIKPGLERIRRLAEMLGDPQDKIKTVHIAGTNGKGSVCALLSSVLTGSGLKTGVYTSPYISDYLEPFQIDGKMISPCEYADIITKIKYKSDLLDSENDCPTEFEINTVAAFLWFSENSCDYAVIETGLGGLLDATNIISHPELCIITSISLDHKNILGNTVEEIAEHKAGIITPGTPVVVSYGQEDTVNAIIKIHTADAPIIFCGAYEKASVSLSGTSFIYENEAYSLPLVGIHQCENAVTALTAAKTLLPYLSCADINKGFSAAVHPARYELFDCGVPVILDGAHNRDGAAVLKKSIEATLPKKPLIGIMGMLADKEYGECVSLLAPLFQKIFTVTPDSPRALSAAELSSVVADYTNCTVCSCFEDAFNSALVTCIPVVVFGSLYLARYARPLISRTADKKALCANIAKLHTTPMGAERIRKNLCISESDILDYCIQLIEDDNSLVYRNGKNFYCVSSNVRITVNAGSYTIITAHII